MRYANFGFRVLLICLAMTTPLTASFAFVVEEDSAYLDAAGLLHEEIVLTEKPSPPDATGGICPEGLGETYDSSLDRQAYGQLTTDGYAYAGVTASRGSTYLGEFVSSYWFSFVVGLASVFGMILALYPIQVRSLPPCVFRSLLWKKTLVLSIGIGLFVFAIIQFYNQPYSPSGSMFGIPYELLHGSKSFREYGDGGPLVWGFVCVFSFLMFFYGAMINPAKKMRILLIDECSDLQRGKKWSLDRLTRDKPYEELPMSEKEIYDQTVQYYRDIQQRIIDIYTGVPLSSTIFANNASANAAWQVEELRSKLRDKFKTYHQEEVP
ncbi:MAG: hypothetical protein JRE64_02230 [Deltaproteobacteria bacterium]|nr:hypothetical protein [Deltaproteobacteria bacterium]